MDQSCLETETTVKKCLKQQKSTKRRDRNGQPMPKSQKEGKHVNIEEKEHVCFKQCAKSKRTNESTGQKKMLQHQKKQTNKQTMLEHQSYQISKWVSFFEATHPPPQKKEVQFCLWLSPKHPPPPTLLWVRIREARVQRIGTAQRPRQAAALRSHLPTGRLAEPRSGGSGTQRRALLQPTWICVLRGYLRSC